MSKWSCTKEKLNILLPSPRSRWPARARITSTGTPPANTWPPSKTRLMTGRSTHSHLMTSVSVARTLATTNTATSTTPTGNVKTVARKPPGRALSPSAANGLTFSFMSRQTTLSDGAQRTLTGCTDTTERKDKTLTTERDLLDRAQQNAADVAAKRFPHLPIDVIE
jgi:hypothetical protein